MFQLLASPIIFAFVVFDMTFLPMFHIGGIHGIPYKLCYLILILFFVFFVYERRKVFGIKLWRQLSVLFLLVILLSWIGSFRHNLYFGEMICSETIRNTIICLLVPMGLLYGMSQKRENLNFIIPFIFIYLFMNIVITFFFADLLWMIKFYNLEKKIEEGFFINRYVIIRSPGLFYNSNITSLVMNMLYLTFVVGIRNKFITYKSTLIYLMVIISVFLLHFLTFSRSEFIAAVLITIFLIYYIFKGRIGYKDKIVSAIKLICIIFIMFILFGYIMERSSFVNAGVDTVISTFAGEKLFDKDNLNENIYRPLSKKDLILKAFVFSPIFGSGFDGYSPALGGLHYHNDWFDILAATGIIGFFLYLLIVRFSIANAGFVMMVPFLLPALTNSFMYAPQSFVLYFIILGFVIRMKALNKNGLLQSKR